MTVMTFRVYHEDTDSAGVVYHPRYLSFFSRARVEWLRDRGFGIGALQEAGILLPVRRVEISYERPAFVDDEIQIFTDCVSRTRVRGVFEQTAKRTTDANEAEILCQARIEICAIARDTHKPIRLPTW